MSGEAVQRATEPGPPAPARYLTAGFVEGGGAYLGLCAGAYYACGSVEFEPGSRCVFLRAAAPLPPLVSSGPGYGSVSESGWGWGWRAGWVRVVLGLGCESRLGRAGAGAGAGEQSCGE